MSDLPGTDTCDDEWHRLKFVSNDVCPTCRMTIGEFNARMRAQEKSRQRKKKPKAKCFDDQCYDIRAALQERDDG